ncbi:MAG: aldo/keto reductase [Planctomycetaceae bacterium]|nr:aldo/keto reductase [Planctomycetaceae bacterium]
MKRREFLETAVLGAGAAVFGTGFVLGADRKKNRPKKTFSTDPLAVVPLTEKVSCTRIGFGTGMSGYRRSSELTRMGEEKAVPLLKFAYDQGIRLFDMADLYGSHSFVAKALEGKPRDSYTLVSKLWYHGGLEKIDGSLEPEVALKRFLKECKTDYLDVLQIHCMMDGDWAVKYAGQMEAMEKLKEQGLIRAHGVSCHANTSLNVAAKTPWTDTVHVRINHEGAKMDGSVDDVVAAVRACHESGIGTIAMKVLGEGTFSDSLEKRRKSAAFVTGLDCIDVMVVGFAAEEHITELIANVRTALEARKAESAV